jgi:hypothetical protein
LSEARELLTRKSTPFTGSLNQTTARTLENRGSSRSRALENHSALLPPLSLDPVSAMITGREVIRESSS